MDMILIVFGFLFCIVGVVGSVLPVLPGPPLGWVGLLLLHLTSAVPMNYWFLGITLVLALAIVVLDYVIPAAGTKRFGGSKSGAWGTTIGLIVGIIVPIPFGILIGPFLGAFIGEVFFNKSDNKTALRAAFGSFLGFLTGTFMKLTLSLIFTGLFIYKGIQYSDALFTS
ncbi:DUF456 domain-containing protein [Croceiramulus getboli]|nr:DUF456 domain-containing protein [Flavobacteriaceae bacterium YJPT1-3]